MTKRFAGISERESLALAYLKHRADRSLSESALQLGLRAKSLRQIVDRLERRGIIQCSKPVINPFRLGYQQYTLLFSINNGGTGCEKKLLDFLCSLDSTIWVGELGGDYQAGATFLVRDSSELDRQLDAVSNRFGNHIGERSISLRVGLQLLPTRYFSPEAAHPRLLDCDCHVSPIRLDARDHLLLDAMTQENGYNLRAFARRLGLPIATVKRRVDNLREENVLLGYEYRYDNCALGVSSHLVLASSKGVRADEHAELRRIALELPNSTYLFKTIGPWNYELGLEGSSAEEIHFSFKRFTSAAAPILKSARLMQIFRVLKSAWYPAVAAGGTSLAANG